MYCIERHSVMEGTLLCTALEGTLLCIALERHSVVLHSVVL